VVRATPAANSIRTIRGFSKARKAERAARRQAEGDQNIQLEEEFRTLGVK
jgi:hypothetical protein